MLCSCSCQFLLTGKLSPVSRWRCDLMVRTWPSLRTIRYPSRSFVFLDCARRANVLIDHTHLLTDSFPPSLVQRQLSGELDVHVLARLAMSRISTGLLRLGLANRSRSQTRCSWPYRLRLNVIVRPISGSYEMTALVRAVPLINVPRKQIASTLYNWQINRVTTKQLRFQWSRLRLQCNNVTTQPPLTS